MTLDHVQVAAPPGCESAARAFYGELLGLKELEKPQSLEGQGGCWFALDGGHQLHIGVQPDFVPAKKAHPAFRVAGFDELRAKLTASGVPVVDDDMLAGVKRFFCHDPWGNRLEFIAM